MGCSLPLPLEGRWQGCDIEPVPRPGETAAPIEGRKLPEEEGGVVENAVTGAGAPVALGRSPVGR